MRSASINCKIQLYGINQQGAVGPADVLATLHEKGVEGRFLVVNGYPVRMEELDRPSNGLVFANFCKQRFHGPGKSSQERLTVDFELNPDEAFGEMTAILLTKDRKNVLVQYNHYGVRSTTIAGYLSGFLPDAGQIMFEPVLRTDVRMKFKMSDALGWVEAKFNFTDVNIESSGLRSFLKNNKTLFHIYQSMHSLDQEHAAKIECKISKKQGNFRGISKDKGDELIRDLLELNDKNVVTSAKVEARYEDGSNEILDLLKAKEEVSCVAELAENQRMIDFNESKKILAQAYLHWKNKGMIDQ